MIAQMQRPTIRIHEQSAPRRANAQVAGQAAGAAWGLALAEAAIGYEWLLSGLNKVLSGDFSSGLVRNLQDSLQGNPNTWYAGLTRALVVPHPGLFAGLVEAGELLVGVGMFAGAAIWLSGRLAASRWARPLNLAVIVALLGGILMSLNYALMGGDTLPWINAGNPFNEGISIDSLLTLIGIGLVAAHAAAARRTTAAARSAASFDDLAA